MMADLGSREVMVMIIGMTGAGKTTFVSVASEKEGLEIGAGIDACTHHPQAVEFDMDGRRVILIDTPGFDDDIRTDVQILEDIAKWLAKHGYMKDRHLDGLILLHPITQLDVHGKLEQKRTRLVKKILGEDAFRRVVIATTMWGFLIEEEEKHARRELDARCMRENGVWHDFIQGGATLAEHDNTKESAHDIIRRIMRISDRAGKRGILLQRELGRDGLELADTSIGQELQESLQDQIGELQQELVDHRIERPPESFRKSRTHWEKEKWRGWEAEHRDLKANLKAKEKQLKHLNSFYFKFLQALSRAWWFG